MESQWETQTIRGMVQAPEAGPHITLENVELK